MLTSTIDLAYTQSTAGTGGYYFGYWSDCSRAIEAELVHEVARWSWPRQPRRAVTERPRIPVALPVWVRARSPPLPILRNA